MGRDKSGNDAQSYAFYCKTELLRGRQKMTGRKTKTTETDKKMCSERTNLAIMKQQMFTLSTYESTYKKCLREE